MENKFNSQNTESKTKENFEEAYDEEQNHLAIRHFNSFKHQRLAHACLSEAIIKALYYSL
jgi:hypothetical protein